MINYVWTAAIGVILALVLVGGGSPRAEYAAPPPVAAPIQAFYGTFKGESISISDEGLGKRDLAISITPQRRGFNLTWTTITYGDDHAVTRKRYSIDFMPTQREGIYASAMRTDMFGNRVPLNPLEGDPFVWATIRGQTLTVYALMITATGGYEMQTYDRTLTARGLHLEFARVRDGIPQRFITGTLVRVSP